MTSRPALTGDSIRAVFDATPAGTVGLEEELMLVDAETWAPVGAAQAVIDAIDDERVKPELASCQVETATSVHTSVGEAVAELRECRARIAAGCPAGVVPVAAAVHPTAARPMELSPTERSAALELDYREVIAHQMVASLQVQVAVGGAERTLAVHDELRRHLPELAALAAGAPFLDGRDTGLCSVRPVIAAQLPRQGVPPAIASWDRFADDLRWASHARAIGDPSVWWWELRPHVGYGTLELRVLDVQPDSTRTLAVASLALALIRTLAAEHDEGRRRAPVASWRIAENRWSALRDGLGGCLLDLDSGEPTPTREHLHRLADRVAPQAPGGLDHVHEAIEEDLAQRLRALGADGVLPWLAERFGD